MVICHLIQPCDTNAGLYHTPRMAEHFHMQSEGKAKKIITCFSGTAHITFNPPALNLVDTKLPESDHLPLVYSILIQQESNTRMPVSQINCANSEWQKYVTDSKGFIVYQDILKSDLRQNELFRFKEAMSSCENVNIVSKLYTDILITSADRVFPKTKIKISGKTKSRPPLWFDIECKELRNKLIQAQKHKLAGDTEIIPSLTKQYRALKTEENS